MHTAVCRIKESLGEIEPCAEGLCPFWEARRLGGDCALERIDFRGREELAAFLLGLRRELESTRTAEDARAARRLFFQRLNAGRSD